MGSKWVAETSESPEFVGELAKARPFPKPRAGCSTHPGATNFDRLGRQAATHCPTVLPRLGQSCLLGTVRHTGSRREGEGAPSDTPLANVVAGRAGEAALDDYERSRGSVAQRGQRRCAAAARGGFERLAATYRWLRRSDSQLPSAVHPPSTVSAAPLMNPLFFSSARNRMALATSSAVAKRPMGTRPVMSRSV